MKVIIDRFEGDYAVCEVDLDTFVNIPKILIPDSIEGDVVNINVDKNETENRKKNIEDLMNNLFD